MNKKIVLGILISALLAISGCGAKEPTDVPDKMSNQVTNDVLPDDSTNGESATDDTSNNEVNPDESTNNDGQPDESTSNDGQSDESVNVVNTVPAVQVSDTLFDYQVGLYGKCYSLPLKISDFVKDGWECKFDETIAFTPGFRMGPIAFVKEKSEILVDITNYDDVDHTASECYISKITVGSNYDFSDEANITIPGNFLFGSAKKEDIINHFGNPYSIEGEEFVEVRYAQAFYEEANFYFLNGVLTSYSISTEKEPVETP